MGATIQFRLECGCLIHSERCPQPFHRISCTSLPSFARRHQYGESINKARCGEPCKVVYSFQEEVDRRLKGPALPWPV